VIAEARWPDEYQHSADAVLLKAADAVADATGSVAGHQHGASHYACQSPLMGSFFTSPPRRWKFCWAAVPIYPYDGPMLGYDLRHLRWGLKPKRLAATNSL